MKRNILFISWLLFYSCIQNQPKNLGCIENAEFKKEYFNNIRIIEIFSSEKENHKFHTIETKEFLKAIDFVSKYAKVSTGQIFNYQLGYRDYSVFTQDKKRWLDWYQKNNCKNIQFR